MMRRTFHRAGSDERGLDAEHRYSKDSVSGSKTVNWRIDNITREARLVGAVGASMTESVVTDHRSV